MMAVDSQFLSVRPRRLLNWEEDSDGRVILLRPKLGSSRLGWWAASHLRNPYYRIRLDEVGALVWKSLDGETKVAEVAGRMRQSFGDRVEPAEERLGLFIRRLRRAGLIEV